MSNCNVKLAKITRFTRKSSQQCRPTPLLPHTTTLHHQLTTTKHRSTTPPHHPTASSPPCPTNILSRLPSPSTSTRASFARHPSPTFNRDENRTTSTGVWSERYSLSSSNHKSRTRGRISSYSCTCSTYQLSLISLLCVFALSACTQYRSADVSRTQCPVAVSALSLFNFHFVVLRRRPAWSLLNVQL